LLPHVFPFSLAFPTTSNLQKGKDKAHNLLNTCNFSKTKSSRFFERLKKSIKNSWIDIMYYTPGWDDMHGTHGGRPRCHPTHSYKGWAWQHLPLDHTTALPVNLGEATPSLHTYIVEDAHKKSFNA